MTVPIAPDAPAPELDEWSAPFWQGLADRRIVIQVCTACERRRFPRMPACPYCAAPGGADVEVAGTGTVYSFVRAHRALTEASAAIVPYAVAAVDLDGGARMFGRVVPTDDCAIGTRVSPVFVDHATWTELCFQVVP